jgi:hypothetical protein
MPEQRDVQRGAHPQIRRVRLDRGQRLAMRPDRLLLLRRKPLAQRVARLDVPDVLRGDQHRLRRAARRELVHDLRARQVQRTTMPVLRVLQRCACRRDLLDAGLPLQVLRVRRGRPSCPSRSGQACRPGSAVPVFGSIPADRNELRSDCAALRRELRSCCCRCAGRSGRAPSTRPSRSATAACAAARHRSASPSSAPQTRPSPGAAPDTARCTSPSPSCAPTPRSSPQTPRPHAPTPCATPSPRAPPPWTPASCAGSRPARSSPPPTTSSAAAPSTPGRPPNAPSGPPRAPPRHTPCGSAASPP